MMQQLTVTVHETQIETLDDFADDNGGNRSEAARTFLEKGIQAHDSRHQWAAEARMGSHMLGLIGIVLLAATLFIPVVPVVQGVALSVTVFIFAVCLGAVASAIEPEGI